MTAFPARRSSPRSREPWFREHPALALVLAAVLYGGVSALPQLDGTTGDASSMLYALPVALMAMTYGLRAGTAAGLLAVGLSVVRASSHHVSPTPAGWVSRALPLLLLGVLLGHATDRVRRADLERRRLESAALLHQEAIELNDTLVQGMVAAKWALDLGEVSAGRQILDKTIDQAHELVSGLIRRADLGARTAQMPLNPSDSHLDA